MKILLIGINAKYIHPSVAVYSLSDYAGRYGVRTKVLEYTINQSYDEIYYGILSQKPDVLAFSVYIWNVALVARLLKDFRKVLPQAKLILGGPEVSFGIPQSIREADYDFCIQGEGERAFTALALSLIKQNSHSEKVLEVPIEWEYICNGKICTSKPMDNPDELPFIYENRMDDFANRILYYEASRGCPFHCSYCLSAAEEGLRVKSAEKVLEELRYLVEHGAKLIKFLDRSFNARTDLALNVLRYIASIEEENPLRFHFELEADTLSEDVLRVFETMPKGRAQLEIGIQSTNPATLKAVRRNPSTQHLFTNIRRLLAVGNVKVHVDLIAGLPYETLDLFKQSFHETYLLGAHELQLGFLKRLKGAPIAAQSEYGNVFSEFPPYEILRTDYLSTDDIAYLKRIEDVLDRYSNSGRFTRFFQAALQKRENAWELFDELTCFIETKKLLFQPLGAMEEFDLLSEFAQGDEDVLTALLTDYYAFTNSDKIPKALAEIEAKPQNASDLSYRLLKEAGQRDLRLMCRFIKGEAHLFDYTTKNAVTGQYDER